MKQVSNKDMLNAIRNEASAEYKERIPAVANDVEARGIYDGHFKDYPSTKNEFIHTLMNKVVKSEFFSKVYENPLKMLKKGNLPFGTAVEELFVEAAKVKGFYRDGFDNPGTANVQDTAQELVGKKDVDVKALYVEKNFAYVFETSISDSQLKGAFLNQNGLSELVNQIVGSLLSGAEQQEFKDMKTILEAVSNAEYLKPTSTGSTPTKTTIPQDQGVLNCLSYEVIGDLYAAEGPKKLAKKLREMAGMLKFPSTEHNMAGVTTWSRPEDLVFITTPKIVAELDVEVLAQAFNVSSADVNTRIILVDKLPTQFKKGQIQGAQTIQRPECYGILMDRDFIQVWDTVNETRQFENGRALMTNMFLHKQGILANCYFANAVAIMKDVN